MTVGDGTGGLAAYTESTSRKGLIQVMQKERFFRSLEYNMRCKDGHRWYMPKRKRGLYCGRGMGVGKTCKQPLQEIRTSKQH